MMNMAKGDDAIVKCFVGERIINHYSSADVFEIAEISYRWNNVVIRNVLTGKMMWITFDRLFRDYEHYIPWSEVYLSSRRDENGKVKTDDAIRDDSVEGARKA